MQQFGFDTETIDGYAVIIATNEDYKRVYQFTDVLNFLCCNYYKSSIMWTWNLRYDTQAIIKLLLLEADKRGDNWREVAEKIYSKKGFLLRHAGFIYKINALDKKFLRISWKKDGNKSYNSINMYDMSQYYGYSKLENVAQKYIGVGKNDSAEWVNKVIAYDNGEVTKEQALKYLDDYERQVGFYCVDDAFLTLKLARYMGKSFTDVNISFKKPLSHAKISENHIKNNCQYPKIPKAIKHYHNFAHASYHGGIFETLQRGFFDEDLYSYDINSAYPFEMAQLPHWADGRFIEVDKPSKDVDYGWYFVSFNCRWIPFDDATAYEPTVNFNGQDVKIVLNNKRVVYPEGDRVQVITRRELDFLKQYGYKYKVIVGLEWIRETWKHDAPFWWILNAYNERKKIKQADKDDLRQLALKICYNSAYGKTAQHKTGFGTLTNFFYASIITAGCRVNIAEIAEENLKNTVEIATDGILLNKPLDIPESSKLGGWEVKEYSAGLIIGSGMHQLYYKDGSYDTYMRGITNKRDYDLMSKIKAEGDKAEIPFTKTRPIQIGECISHIHALDLNDLNRFTPVTRSLNVNSDTKHHWNKEYSDFNDLLDNRTYAKPLNVSELTPVNEITY